MSLKYEPATHTRSPEPCTLNSDDSLTNPKPNVQRFQGGLVFKAHRLLYHSTLGLRVIKKKRRTLNPTRFAMTDDDCPALVALCLGPYGGPRGGAFSNERGTPVTDDACPALAGSASMVIHTVYAPAIPVTLSDTQRL